MQDRDSTLVDVGAPRRTALVRWGRPLGVLVLLLLVVSAAFGVFGVHSRTVSATADGWTLTVTYPQSARAGLDVPWRARVTHPGGLPKSITLAVSTDYFRMFETQGFYPDADTTTNDGTFVYFTFTTPPHGNTFLLDYDAYIQPGSQLGKSATVEVLIGGRIVTRTHLRTWLVP